MDNTPRTDPRMARGPRGGSRQNKSKPAPQTAPVVHVAAPQPMKVDAPAPALSGRHFSTVRFADAPICEASKKGIKHEFMSDVQAATIQPALEGKDLLVQAKTGTGKTVAFLLPTIERLSKLPLAPLGQISVLILSPTRELALQIQEEAKMILQFHPFKAQHAIGGTNMRSETSRLFKERCDILVATPGRLLDHIENGGLKAAFSGLKSLIFDEADRLLDQGFRKELEKIVKYLPNRDVVPRQAMLFSATVSQEVKSVASFALSTKHTFISTLLADEVNTHEHVEQTSIITALANALPAALNILREDSALHPGASKVMVFFPTARSTGLAAEVLSKIPGLPTVLEIHSRKSQSQRTKAADLFKDAKSAILMSSDVAARGMDFPGVTLVLQVGLPANGEQYIHRLGRTARAGASGRGIVILAPFEQFFLNAREVRELGIKPHVSKSPIPSPKDTEDTMKALEATSNEPKEQAYQAWIGYYKGSLRDMRMTSAQLVQTANEYAWDGLRYKGNNTPPLLAKTVGKMGLKGVPGLNIVHALPERAGGGGQSRGPSGASTPRGGGGGGRGNGSARGRGGRGRGGGGGAGGGPRVVPGAQ